MTPILIGDMGRRITTLDDAPVDVIEALKRGFIHRGYIPGKYRRNSPLKQDFEETEQKQPKNDSSSPFPATEAAEVHEKLIDLTEKAQDVLFKADTVFPFTFFPDTVSLDREKLTVVQRFFFRVAKIMTVPITSMISAEANVGPFFGSVEMTSKYFVNNTHVVKFLWRKEAEELHRMLQGFIIAQERDLDVTDIQKDDLKVLLNDLGEGTAE